MPREPKTLRKGKLAKNRLLPLCDNFRRILLVALILTSFSSAIHSIGADDVTFTASSVNHKPVVRWAASPSQPTYAYACAYHSTTPSEETIHPAGYWAVEATQITVSFPDTPDASVIGGGNWLAAGMFVHSCENGSVPGHTLHTDWAYYTVVVLDSGGSLWLDVGIYKVKEGPVPDSWDKFIKTWLIGGVSRSTPMTLTASWNASGFIYWTVTVNGVTYRPQGAEYNMRLNEPTAMRTFYVGWNNIFPYNTPYFCCYYFQFGIMSPNQIMQGGWNALLENPQWYDGTMGEWHIVQQAQTMQGPYAYHDSVWMWGGENALVEVKCYNNNASMGRYKAKFYHWIPGLFPNYYLWSHEPTTPPRPLGRAYGYTDTYYRYDVYSTDPEGTQIQFLIYWGDNTYASTDWVASGTTPSVWHAWSLPGTYNVEVCAFDYPLGLQSDWSPSLTVSIITEPPPGGGGCPFVSVRDGSSYVLDNNVLPRSVLNNETDIEDYYRLEHNLVPQNGKYRLLLSEFENEHSYIDQVKLLAVDHQSDVNIAATPEGEILTYKNPAASASAVDNYGNNRLNEISFMDGNVSDPATYFYGTPGDYLILDFGQVNSNTAKLILRDDMKKQIDECILVQVKNGSGVWQTVETLVPRAYWSMEAVDLSAYVVQGQDLTVRLYWLQPHRLDFVGLDTTPQANYDIRSGNLVSATHSAQGDVKTQLLENDNVYAELLPDQQIQLEFTLPNNSKEARTCILYTKGHYYTIP